MADITTALPVVVMGANCWRTLPAFLEEGKNKDALFDMMLRGMEAFMYPAPSVLAKPQTTKRRRKA